MSISLTNQSGKQPLTLEDLAQKIDNFEMRMGQRFVTLEEQLTTKLTAKIVEESDSIGIIVKAGFDEVYTRLDKLEAHAKQTDQHFVKIDQHLEDIDQHLEDIDQHLEGVDQNLVEIKHRQKIQQEQLDVHGYRVTLLEKSS